MSYIFVKLIWNTNPIFPSIRITKIGNENVSEIPLQIGEEFNIKVHEKKLCIGTDTKKYGWITCIKSHRLKSLQTNREKNMHRDFLQCYTCRSEDYFACRKICQGDICTPSTEKARSLCTPPDTMVYLTHVGGEVKVGVSLGLPRRWLEQGSDYSTILAKLPGLEARRLEQQISKKLFVKLQVRNTDKIRNFNPPSYENGAGEIFNKIEESQELLNEIFTEVEGKKINDPEVFDLTQNYGNLDITSTIQPIEVRSGQEFGGQIVAIKGSLIVVKQNLYYFALDTKRMSSLTFSFLNRSAKNKGQSTLEEWF